MPLHNIAIMSTIPPQEKKSPSLLNEVGQLWQMPQDNKSRKIILPPKKKFVMNLPSKQSIVEVRYSADGQALTMVAHLDREVDVTVAIQSICVIDNYKPLGPNSHGHIKESERRAFNQKYIDELVENYVWLTDTQFRELHVPWGTDVMLREIAGWIGPRPYMKHGFGETCEYFQPYDLRSLDGVFHAWCTDHFNNIYDFPTYQLQDGKHATMNIVRRPWDASLVTAAYDILESRYTSWINQNADDRDKKAELVERIHNNTFPANEESSCYFRARLLQEANPHYVVIIGSLGYVQPYDGRVFWAYG